METPTPIFPDVTMVMIIGVYSYISTYSLVHVTSVGEC